MSGRRNKPTVARIKPRRVVTRQSTDILAVEDAEVAAALRFIREKACTGIHVQDVLERVTVSQSLLERRFKQCIGRSPHAQIRTLQLRRAAQLLEETDLPLKQITSSCGISRLQYLSYLFKQAYGSTPGAYRRLHAKMSP